MYLCGSQQAGEDLVQETYLQAWKYWHTFQLETDCRAWLFRILFNLKKKSRSTKATHVPLEEANLENVLWYKPAVEGGEVLKAFDTLSEDYRAVMLLVLVEEMSYKEAARTLSVPVGTVMSRLNRGRAQLRKTLGQTTSRGLSSAAGAG